MRLAFAGTPEFARAALQHLLLHGFEIPLVLTQPDRPAGRGMKLQASPVKALAVDSGLAVLQPAGLRLDGAHAESADATRRALANAEIDAIVVAAYGLILPAWMLTLPPRGCLNVHASLLPRWRGAAPIHRAIEAGDAETGITIMQMDEGLDTGGMLLVEREAIRPDDSTATLHDRLAQLGGRLIVQALRALERGELSASPQPAQGISYARKVEKHEAAIDWTEPADVIERRVRAFDPFPGASFSFRGEPLKLWRAAAVAGSGAPGTVLARQPDLIVACGHGALRLEQVQRSGGRRAAAREFFSAHPPAPEGSSVGGD